MSPSLSAAQPFRMSLSMLVKWPLPALSQYPLGRTLDLKEQKALSPPVPRLRSLRGAPALWLVCPPMN